MKILSKIIFIILFLFITPSISTKFNEISSSDFLTYCEESQNNIFQNQNYKSESNNITINDTAKYLAPSYFALIVKEIVPKGSNLTDFIKNSTCLKKYFMEENYTKIADLVKYSAKSFPDYGDEEGCLSHNNNAFVLFAVKYNYLNSIKYSGQFKLLPFISSGYSFYGLCVENTDSCTTIFTDNIKKMVNGNKGMLNGIENLTMTTFIHYSKDSNKNKYFSKTSYYIIYTFFFLVIFIRAIIWGIGSSFFKDKDEFSSKKKKSDKDSSSSSSSSSDEEEETNTRTKDKIGKKEISAELIEKEEIILPKKKIYPKFYLFYRICSFEHGFKILYQKYENLYYNEKDLFFIIFFRFLAYLLKVLYSNLNYITHNPSKEINNTNAFNYSLIAIVKLSSFSDIIIIITESIFISYKLMSFIRKYAKKTEAPSFGLFLNFFLRIIPSIITLIIIFICFYVYNDSLIAALHLNEKEQNLYDTKIQHLTNNIMNCQSCINDWKNIIPFYMNYANYHEEDNFNENCFEFMIIVVNLFYCYCLCIFLTYISFKIKNKIFDISLSIIFIIYYFLPNSISCKSYLDIHNYFNINLLFGETCSITYTHLFINYYFLGFLIGFALFYNNDLTNEYSLQNSNIYKPFYYLKDIVGYIFKRATWVHILIIIITFGIQLLLSFSFLFYSRNNINIENLQILNGFDDFIYLNEKKIFALAFGLFVTHLYIYKYESKLKEFGNDIVVISTNRIGYEFYALIETIVTTMYSSFGLNYNITAQNLLFVSYGIIFFLYFNSLVIFIAFQLPVKIIIKKILKLQKDS